MSPPLSILILINSLGTGGAERSLSELLPVLRDSGVDANVVCLERRSEGVEQSILKSGQRVRFLSGRTLATRVTEFRRILKRERPNLIHTTLFESDLVGRLGAAGTHIPVLTSLVNTPYGAFRAVDPNLTAAKLRTVQIVDAFTSRHLTTHFHALTETVKEAAVEKLRVSDDCITVAPRGRDPQRLGFPSLERRAAARTRLGIHADRPLLLNVGRQEHQKGQRYLIEAMPSLLESVPDALLLIAGRRGHASNELESICSRLNLGTSVRFLGHRDDVPELLAACDVFVFPSLWEGLGGGLIEAMALGLPIVASRLRVFEEVLEDGHNATLVEPAVPRELADAVDNLLRNHGTRNRFGERSREIFDERFTLATSASRIIDLYRVLANGPAGEEAERNADHRRVEVDP